MKFSKCFMAAMKSQKMKQADVAEKIGVKNEGVISSRMNMKNISVNVMIEMLDSIGYDLVIKPKDGVDGDSYTITIEE